MLHFGDKKTAFRSSLSEIRGISAPRKCDCNRKHLRVSNISLFIFYRTTFLYLYYTATFLEVQKRNYRLLNGYTLQNESTFQRIACG